MAKKSKILLALLLMLVMAMSAACSDSGEEIKEPAGVSGSSGAPAGEAGDAGSSAEPSEESPEESSGGEVTVDETVLYEADGIRVTATGYEEGWMGPEVKLLVENSTEQNVVVTAGSVSVNGYMTPYSSLYAEVAAGKKSNEVLTLLSSELEQAGIETVAELQFCIEVADAETWDTLASSGLITLNTSAVGLEQPVDESGDVLYEENGIKIVCKGLKQDIIWDGTIVFYMANSSGQPITVYAENVSVNGFMQDAGLWSDLRDGTRIVDGMSLLDLSDLELESIDEVENIEFSLRIINSETWEEIAATDVITLSF